MAPIEKLRQYINSQNKPSAYFLRAILTNIPATRSGGDCRAFVHKSCLSNDKRKSDQADT